LTPQGTGARIGQTLPVAPEAEIAASNARTAPPLMLPGRSWGPSETAAAKMLRAEQPNLEAGLAGQYAAEQQGALSEAAGAQQLAEREAEVNRRMQVSWQDEQAAQQRYRDQEAATLKGLQDETDQLAKSAPRQKSAGEYLGGMSNGNKVAAIIGLALGGLGETITGKQNPALVQLERETERDLANQQRQYAAAKDAAAKRATTYGQLMERYQDKVIAERQYRAMQADQLARYTQQIGNTTKSDALRAKAAGLSAELQGKAATQRMDIAKGIAAGQIAGGSTGPTINPAILAQLSPQQIAEAKQIAKDSGQPFATVVASRYQAGTMLPGQGPTMTPEAQKDIDKEVAGISKEMSDKKIAASKSSLAALEDIARQESPAGVGPVKYGLADSYAGTLLLSDEGLRNQQAINRAASAEANRLSGSGMSEAEAARRKREFLGAGKNVQGLRNTVEATKREIAAQEAEILARARPEVVAEYRRREAAAREAQMREEIRAREVKGGVK